MFLTRGILRRLKVVFVINVTDKNREQACGIALAALAILKMTGHFDAVLRHNKFIDFFP